MGQPVLEYAADGLIMGDCWFGFCALSWMRTGFSGHFDKDAERVAILAIKQKDALIYDNNNSSPYNLYNHQYHQVQPP
jgi:hypothetical protein